MSSDPHTLLNVALEALQKRYARDTTQSPPMVFGCRNNQIDAILQLDFDNDLAKAMSVEAARLFLFTNGYDASIFTSEAWMSVQDAGDVDENGYVRPSQDPKRMEVLLAEISTPGHFVMVVQQMLRNSDGELTGFEEVRRMDSMEHGGEETIYSRFDFFNGINKGTVH